MKLNIGYPDTWRDDLKDTEFLTVVQGGSFFDNVVAIAKTQRALSIQYQKDGVDKTEWPMGFCIACFLRDIAGAVGMHSAAKVQYVRPEIIGLVLGAFIMSVATKEFRAKAGSSPATRFILGGFVMIGALAFLGCPLRMVIRLGGGDANALVGLLGFIIGIVIGVQFLKRGFSLKRAYEVGKVEGGVLPIVMGFTIMESFMDALTVHSTPGRGTTVTMRKKIASRVNGQR